MELSVAVDSEEALFGGEYLTLITDMLVEACCRPLFYICVDLTYFCILKCRCTPAQIYVQ